MSICLEIIPSSARIPTAKELKDEIEKLIVLESPDDDCEYEALTVWELIDKLESEAPTAQEIADKVKKDMGSDDYCKLIWDKAGVTSPNVLVEYLKSSFDPIAQTEKTLERCSDGSLSLSMEGFTYGWISIDAYKAGFDFYYDYDDDRFMYNYMVEMLELTNKEAELKEHFSLEAASNICHSWMLRGSAGRSRASWLLAGITAVALAKQTRGIIFSDDGGGDIAKLPADPDSFLDWFPAWCYRNFSC